MNTSPNAYEELVATGRLGDEGVRLLYRTIRHVARARNFPPPSGRERWSFDDVAETAAEFYAGTNALPRLISLAEKADDLDSFTRLLNRTVLNHLRAQARQTTTGRLIRRLKDLLAAHEQIVVIPDGHPAAGALTLRGNDLDTVWNGRHQDLVQAAYSVDDIPLVRWREDSERDAPVADGASLVRISLTVLEAAGGSLRWADLARVVADRFGLGDVPYMLDTDDTSFERHVAMPDPVDELLTEMSVPAAAAAVLAQLTDTEQIVLAVMERSTSEIAEATGLPRSTANHKKNRVQELILRILEGEELGEQIFTKARDLAGARFGIEISH
jgi:hypothetical protein